MSGQPLLKYALTLDQASASASPASSPTCPPSALCAPLAVAVSSTGCLPYQQTAPEGCPDFGPGAAPEHQIRLLGLLGTLPLFTACPTLPVLRYLHCAGRPAVGGAASGATAPQPNLRTSVQAGQPWATLLEALLRWHSNAPPPAEALDNSALAETLQEAMEFSNEFSKLANAHIAPPPLLPQVRRRFVLCGGAFVVLRDVPPPVLLPVNRCSLFGEAPYPSAALFVSLCLFGSVC